MLILYFQGHREKLSQVVVINLLDLEQLKQFLYVTHSTYLMLLEAYKNSCQIVDNVWASQKKMLIESGSFILGWDARCGIYSVSPGGPSSWQLLLPTTEMQQNHWSLETLYLPSSLWQFHLATSQSGSFCVSLISGLSREAQQDSKINFQNH